MALVKAERIAYFVLIFHGSSLQWYKIRPSSSHCQINKRTPYARTHLSGLGLLDGSAQRFNIRRFLCINVCSPCFLGTNAGDRKVLGFHSPAMLVKLRRDGT